MSVHSVRKALPAAALLVAGLFPFVAQAGGVVLGKTRIVYPAGQKQVSLSVKNTADASRYMVQSWVGDADNDKNADFVVTPPLYVSNPQDENALRLMYVGPTPPPDREKLYFLTVKAIPAIDKDSLAGKNVLMFAAATRIKLFLRPDGLSPQPEEAPSRLTFSRAGQQVTVKNPTPYYITLAQIKVAGQELSQGVMVPPAGESTFSLPSARAGRLSFRTFNDYGGLTPEISREL